MCAPSTARAYIDIIPSLGRLVADARAIAVLQVEKVDREKRIVLFRVTEVLANPDQVQIPDKVRHLIGGGTHPLESKQLLDWAKPGKTAVALIAGKVAITCIDHEWYEVSQIDPATWSLTRGRSELTFAYSGMAETFRTSLVEILAGKEVTVTAVRWGASDLPAEAVAYKQSLRGRDVPMWRIRASLTMPGNVGAMVESPRWIVGPGYGDAEDVPPLLTELQSADADRRAIAAETLGWIGRPARPALKRLLEHMQDPDETVAVRAVAAVLRIDPRHEQGLAALRKMMQSDQPDVRRAALAAASELGRNARTLVEALVAATNDPDGDVRWAAVEALGQCRDVPAVAVPALLDALANRELQVPAMAALAMIGPAAVAASSALTKLLNDPEPALQWAAAITLLRCDKDAAQKALPLFLRALGSDNGRTRWDAIWYFEQLPEPQAALPQLAALLENTDPGVRDSALMVLGNIGENAAATLPAVVRALEDGSPAVRNAAARALSLMRIDDATIAQRAAAVLAELFSRSDPPPEEYVLWDTADYLRRLGPTDKIAAPTFCRLTTHANARVRGAALEALYNLGDIPESAGPAVRKCLADSDPGVKLQAVRTGLEMDFTSDDVGPALSDVLKNGDAKLREDAIKLIHNAEANLTNQRPILQERLHDEAPRVRLAAAELVWSLDKQAAAVLPIFVAALDDPDAEVRQRAARGLGRLGPAANGAASDKLLVALGDRNARVRVSAASSLHALGRDAGTLLPVLVEALNDADDAVRQYACEVLGEFGAASKEVLPALRELLQEDARELRFAAAAAILRIADRQVDAPALSAVIQNLNEGDLQFRARVIEFLGELGPAAHAAAPALRILSEHRKEEIATPAKAALLKVSGLAAEENTSQPEHTAASPAGGAASPAPNGVGWLWPGILAAVVVASALIYGLVFRR